MEGSSLVLGWGGGSRSKVGLLISLRRGGGKSITVPDFPSTDIIGEGILFATGGN